MKLWVRFQMLHCPSAMRDSLGKDFIDTETIVRDDGPRGFHEGENAHWRSKRAVLRAASQGHPLKSDPLLGSAPSRRLNWSQLVSGT